jgi:3-methylcrotonyl-CoA carboxylase alpha subunit
MKKKILISNRGEIARRIIKAVKQSGFNSVAVYSTYDKDMPFVKEADEAYELGSGSLSDTYLNIQKIIHLALQAGADAIHPGYGFLSENADFVKACENNHIIFVGPRSDVVSLMGNKVEARALVESINQPVIKGASGNKETILKETKDFRYPLLVKAAQGGGGKGMILVEEPARLYEALESAERQAKNFFGDNEIFVEEYIPNARHIEVQIIADHHGRLVHLFERECSLQRRYQKIIEEAPSPSIDEATRNNITASAISIARAINYTNAGTIEFLMDENNQFYFLEMNTRVQVEHPVTEMITGIDIVNEQLSIAFDHPLTFEQKNIKMKGHAIETRVYAEDSMNDFSPSTGIINAYQEPHLSNIRIDAAIKEKNQITPYYDSMISKVISWGTNRQESIKSLKDTLSNYLIDGVFHSLPYLHQLLQSTIFEKAAFNTSYIDHYGKEIQRLLSEKYDKYLPVAIIIAALLYHLPADAQNENLNNTVSWRNVPRYNISHNMEMNEVYLTELASKLFKASLNGQSWEVMLNVHQKNGIICQINQESYRFKYAMVDRGIHLFYEGLMYELNYGMTHLPKTSVDEKKNNQSSNLIISPLHGRVIKVNVREKTKINKGDTLFVIESMKMENKVLALADAIVKAIHVEIGQQVDNQTVLLTMDV